MTAPNALAQQNLSLMDEWTQDPVNGTVVGLKRRGSGANNFLPLAYTGSPASDNITATAGGTQATAYQLVHGINRITTVATAADAVALYPALAGCLALVLNAGANALQLFGNNGNADTIDGVATATGISVPPNTAMFLLCVTAGSWTSALLTQSDSLPFLQRTTITAANGVIPAANLAGAENVTLIQSGATALTTPTAAALLAAMPGAGPGVMYRLRLINANGGTLTLTMDASVTGVGTLTLATGTFRDFDVQILTATTASMSSVGTGTNS